MNAMQKLKSHHWFAGLTAALVLAGCSSGGAPTTENPPPPGAVQSDYVGPASANPDVQAFRIELWEKIRPNNRCGSCHGVPFCTAILSSDVLRRHCGPELICGRFVGPLSAARITRVRCWPSSR